MRSQRWPPLIRPMLATAGDVRHDRGWVYEFKWDGVPALAYTEGVGGLRLMSRNDLDVTTCYPELAAVADVLGRRAILDGARSSPLARTVQPATVRQWAERVREHERDLLSPES
jgi:ATP-dependent DNA ligase